MRERVREKEKGGGWLMQVINSVYLLETALINNKQNKKMKKIKSTNNTWTRVLC